MTVLRSWADPSWAIMTRTSRPGSRSRFSVLEQLVALLRILCALKLPEVVEEWKEELTEEEESGYRSSLVCNSSVSEAYEVEGLVPVGEGAVELAAWKRRPSMVDISR